MGKRIVLFLAMNVAILLILTIVISILSGVFGINIGGYFSGSSDELMPLLIFSAVVGFSGAFISLAASRFIAKWMYKPVIITSENIHSLSLKEKKVYELVQNISEREHIKMPEVGIYNSTDPNAFATGPTKNRSLVCVSTGLLDIMNNDEIEGVVAHEMAHITNGDMVTMTLLQGIINTFVIFLSRIAAYAFEKFILKSDQSNPWVYYGVSFVLQIIFGILASMILAKFSRYREYRADEGSAIYVGKEKMIASLKKLQEYTGRITTDDTDTYATAKIASKKSKGFLSFFSTHPDLELRIRNLEEKNLM